MLTDESREHTTPRYSQTPVRLRRARFVLLGMGAIVVVVSVWEVANHNLQNGWAQFPLQLFRLVVPLLLLRAIWAGHAWSRYALAVFCAYTLYVNFPMLQQFPKMLRNASVGDAGLTVALFVGYAIMAVLSLFSPAIDGLMSYRRDDRELE